MTLEDKAHLLRGAISGYGTQAMPSHTPLDGPKRLSPVVSSGAVIFTPTPVPTVIVSPIISTPAPTVIVPLIESASSTSSADNSLPHADSALDGMHAEGSTSASQPGSETKSREESV